MPEDRLKLLLQWFMACDPWPLSLADRYAVEALLDEMAQRRGYQDWPDAWQKLFLDAQVKDIGEPEDEATAAQLAQAVIGQFRLPRQPDQADADPKETHYDTGK